MAIEARDVPYQDGETTLTGVLAFDAGGAARPGIALVHGGAGLDAHAREQAERYAGLGYTVLAVDMFGGGGAGDREAMMNRIRSMRDDPDGLARRAAAGVTALRACEEASGCFAAVGFCFGGTTVLTMARAGMDLRGVISMHGGLSTPRRAEKGAVSAEILACHGASDPHVPMTDVAAFAEEMDAAGATWRMVMYGGAVHGFTHRDAAPGARPGVEYDEAADRDSFDHAARFLAGLV
jgi:dienelactone hydrolase